MNIGYDAKRLFSNHTGLGNYSRSLVQLMQHNFPEEQYHLFTPRKEKRAATRAFFDSKKFHIHESKSRIKSYWRSFSITKDLAATGIDIYHGLSNELPYNLAQKNIKSVVTIHDLIFKIYPETYSISERLVYEKKFRNACNNADRIIAISQNTKNDIIRFYNIDPEKITVVYQSCEATFYTLKDAGTVADDLQKYKLPSQYFLSLGSVEERKNLKLTIRAYSQLAGKTIIPLVIVGKGSSYKSECKNMIATLGLESQFIWLDTLDDNSHLQSIIQNATALIYPSFYEGFGLPIAEALLSKTPVIAANTSSLREAGGPQSIYINPNNVAELASAMLQLIDNPNLQNEMAESGYQYAQTTFAPKHLSGQMHKIYCDLFIG